MGVIVLGPICRGDLPWIIFVVVLVLARGDLSIRCVFVMTRTAMFLTCNRWLMAIYFVVSPWSNQWLRSSRPVTNHCLYPGLLRHILACFVIGQSVVSVIS